MRTNTPTRSKFLAALPVTLGWCFLCMFAPWRQVHPSNASLVQSLSRAPLWTRGYEGLPGAGVDGPEFLLEAALILFASVLILTIYRSALTRYYE